MASVQVRPILNGYDLIYQGIEAKARVYTKRESELMATMPIKQPPDTSKFLLCPMPGLVVSLAVTEGQQVAAGESLCVVEAMKMENVLKAERDGVVAKIKAKPGDSLNVDAVILEFKPDRIPSPLNYNQPPVKWELRRLSLYPLFPALSNTSLPG